MTSNILNSKAGDGAAVEEPVAPRNQASDNRNDGVACNPDTIHVIGAGLAGLSAAVSLSAAGKRVVVWEAARQAGGRCRSYFDSAIGEVIDNGNHLLLSGNSAALAFLKKVGGLDRLQGPGRAQFSFADYRSGRRWTLDINEGRFPFWLFNSARRVPDTKPQDYLSAAGLMWARGTARVTDYLRQGTPLYERLWHPLILAALNTAPEEGSAKLAGAIMRETLAKGGRACHPLIAEGLSEAFIEPALRTLAERGVTVRFAHRLRAIESAHDAAKSLDFGDHGSIRLGGEARVILAVPPWVATQLLPEITAPDDYRSILNAHYRVAPPPDFPKILGVTNAKTEWLFAFPGRMSITISGADRLIDEPREKLASDLWEEVAALTGLSRTLPPWQIVKEKRATFAATPEQDAKRPGAQTRWRNVFLAGDWTQTGLPATIEGAIRSGERAAYLAMKGYQRHGISTERGIAPGSASQR